mgnify:CR=1 FL=1
MLALANQPNLRRVVTKHCGAAIIHIGHSNVAGFQ